MTEDEAVFTSEQYRPKGNGGGDDAGKRAQDGKPPRFSLVKFDDVLMSTTSFYLVKNLIPRSGLVVVWGPPKCGKSFWTFDLFMHVALGWEYRGLRVKQGHVVYCVLEGEKGFTRRIEAFRRTYSESKGAPFYLMFMPLDLIHDHKALIASIRAQLPEGVDPSAVVIDTLNRSLVGSESKDEDMAAYVRAADAIHNAFGCVVPIVHHCGHSADRPRGHSSLLGAADVQIAVVRDDANNVVAIVEYAKDGRDGLQIVSRLVEVDLGEDEDGEAMTSLVVEPVGEPGAKSVAKNARPKRLSNSAEIALRALRLVIGEIGEIPQTNHAPPGVKGVTVQQWRDFAFRAGISKSDDAHARAVAFNRASDALQVAGKIGVWESEVWPVYEQTK